MHQSCKDDFTSGLLLHRKMAGHDGIVHDVVIDSSMFGFPRIPDP